MAMGSEQGSALGVFVVCCLLYARAKILIATSKVKYEKGGGELIAYVRVITIITYIYLALLIHPEPYVAILYVELLPQRQVKAKLQSEWSRKVRS